MTPVQASETVAETSTELTPGEGGLISKGAHHVRHSERATIGETVSGRPVGAEGEVPSATSTSAEGETSEDEGPAGEVTLIDLLEVVLRTFPMVVPPVIVPRRLRWASTSWRIVVKSVTNGSSRRDRQTYGVPT
ncbi:hypothetical protein [Methanopyrus kandleri]|uniref:hypothetical protein n=1 Tax=Methanopyrus kandleri TaxID=2320 RepID=UPI0011E551EE|nr:hypothetical protein [Methanopyrus kandleri]